MSTTSDKLISLIKPLIRQEIKSLVKVLAPLIKEEVEKQVNKILAEQFVKGLSGGNQLGNVFSESQKNEPEIKKEISSKEEKEKQKKHMKAIFEQKMAQLNIPQEDFNLFQDLPAGKITAPGAAGMISDDDDDEGVDLSRLGL